MKASKCPNCTASIGLSQDSCKYCGAHIDHDTCVTVYIEEMHLNNSTITRSNVKVIGNFNKITGDNVFVKGNNNTIKGNFVTMNGAFNKHIDPNHKVKKIDREDKEVTHNELIIVFGVMLFFLIVIILSKAY